MSYMSCSLLEEKFMNRERMEIVDLAPRAEYDQSHIKGAMSIPLEKVREKADIYLKKDDMIVLYTHEVSSEKAEEASKILRRSGFNNIHIFTGGLKEWTMKNLPLAGEIYKNSALD